VELVEAVDEGAAGMPYQDLYVFERAPVGALG
jgi:hypothetical protein